LSGKKVRSKEDIASILQQIERAEKTGKLSARQLKALSAAKDILAEHGKIDPSKDVPKPPEKARPPINAKETAKALGEALVCQRDQDFRSIDDIATSLAANLGRQRGLDSGPGIEPGAKGVSLAFSSSAASQLLSLSGRSHADGQEAVIWDDGVNELVVWPGKMELTLTEGLARVKIPVECDQLSTMVEVPFAVGSSKRLSGMVMAAPERPIGDVRITRIWGEALIALAHRALVDMADALARPLGRSVDNQALEARGIIATRGQLVVETQAGQPKGGCDR